MAATANEQVVRPPAAEQVALAVAEAAGNQPRQAEGQVLVQQVFNAPNDGGGHANAPALKFLTLSLFKDAQNMNAVMTRLRRLEDGQKATVDSCLEEFRHLVKSPMFTKDRALDRL
ncbi:unnamed protein product [Porites evermanni]|uniref:Retrotransposon gag domain-containing protein n=1 Tax=Porites evermanni TaxID=104178 RepID=A0ABN8MCW7_9CNID|nr:unnamed protein product [Porites evermanni]